MSRRILLVEDEAVIRHTLRRLLERNGYEVAEAQDVRQAREIGLHQVDLIVADVRLPGEMGTVLITEASPTPVVVMTSYSDTREAVSAMKAGAVSYLIKPFEHAELLGALEDALATVPAMPAALKQDTTRVQLIGRSPAMLQLQSQIERVAPLNVTVLVQGESGSGKELVARALHELSPRAEQPWIAVNCAAIPPSLIESELFGHEKGAFTGANQARMGLVEAADKGTLFLDEIGELPLEVQGRLLRLLQEREIRRVGGAEVRKVNIRLITATHRDLLDMVRQQQFREDLYYRLDVVRLVLPPLRERGEDIILLANHLLGELCRRHQRSILTLTPAAEEHLRRFNWPGNVRQLQNVLERAVILSNGISLDVNELQLEPNAGIPVPSAIHHDLDMPLSLNEQFIETVRRFESTMSETELAEKLGISRKTLWERRQRLGIPRQARRRSR